MTSETTSRLEPRTIPSSPPGRDSGKAPAVGRPGGPSWAAYLLVFGLALIVRLGFQAGFIGFQAPPRDDEELYDSIAVSLAGGGDYVDEEGFRSRRAPAFSFLLAGVYAIAGHDLAAARVVQAVVGSATCVMLLGLGARIVTPATGLTAALACALLPHSIFWSGSLTSEPLCTLLAVASVASLVQGAAGPGVPMAWAILSALMALTRPNMGLVFLLGALWMLACGGRGAWRRIAPAAAIFLLLLLPWTIRNFAVHGRLIPVTTMGGVVLWQGNNPIVASSPELRGRSLPGALTTADPASRLPEAESDREFFAKAVRFMRERPLDMPGLVAWKFARLWNPFPQFASAAQRWIATITLLPVFALFAIGLGSAYLGRDGHILPVLIPIVAVTLTGVLYWADARIRAPADPLILLVAAYGVDSLRARLRPAGRSRRLLL